MIMSPATVILIDFRCTVYPERSEGHSCTDGILFNFYVLTDYTDAHRIYSV